MTQQTRVSDKRIARLNDYLDFHLCDEPTGLKIWQDLLTERQAMWEDCRHMALALQDGGILDKQLGVIVGKYV